MSVNNFGLFFTRDGTVLRLPVTPEKLPVARDNANDDYNVLGIGPIMVPRIPKLKVVTISSFFPGRPFSGVLTPNQFLEPEAYIQFFESAMNDKAVILYTPVRYYENGEPFFTGDTGFQCLVTNFNTEERGGETGDFYYDLEITEYRDYSPGTLQVKQTSPSLPATVTTEPSRDIPQGQLYVGALAVANGTCYQTSSGGGTATPVSGQRVNIVRINNEQPNAVYVTTENGTALGWIVSSGLQVVSET